MSLPVLSTTSNMYAIQLLIFTLCSLLLTTRADDFYNPPYKIKTQNNGVVVVDDNVVFKSVDGGEDFDFPVNKLEIFWLNSTTNSISVRWALKRSYNLTGYIENSIVEYFPKGGRFTSHPLSSDVREYTYENLNAGTLYTICVYMMEIHGEYNESIVHSKCVKINTINYIRKDSVVIMLITVGYYAFMGLIGYTQWKRRIWRVRNSSKNRYNEDVASDTSAPNVCVMRWRELAEKETLMSKPGCSIECNDT